MPIHHLNEFYEQLAGQFFNSRIEWKPFIALLEWLFLFLFILWTEKRESKILKKPNFSWNFSEEQRKNNLFGNRY